MVGLFFILDSPTTILMNKFRKETISISTIDLSLITN